MEEKMTDPNEPIELLFSAMELGDNRRLFDDIVVSSMHYRASLGSCSPFFTGFD
jgi:hypothetical protein